MTHNETGMEMKYNIFSRTDRKLSFINNYMYWLWLGWT